jgi:uncharacterized membrane protein
MLSLLTLAAAVGCGLVAGVFFGFSTFVMRALARLPAAQGIAAMQSINVMAIRPLFMTALFGTAAACVALAIAAIANWPARGTGYLLAGSLCYLVGAIGVTILFNVPRNNVLATLDANAGGSIGPWTEYLRTWTAWNHVRTATSLVAAVLLTNAFCLGGAIMVEQIR